MDFNPRSHERSDRKGFYIFMDNSISIHAPTRGATSNTLQFKRLGAISIHAPTRGATGLLYFKPAWCSKFQSTLPREERRCINAGTLYSFRISIHAPTRGATLRDKDTLNVMWNFNPRSHERSDKYVSDDVKFYFISIHAPTRGATQSSFAYSTLTKGFQSTLPREERHQLCSRKTM